MKNRVCTLYRVSTDKQVDHNDKNQADIPMQRKACHAFCEKMGWVIVHEEQEEGVSGHKVRAENRDKLQIIKERYESAAKDFGGISQAPKRGSSVSTATRTSSPTTSAFGRLTVKAKRLLSVPKPHWASSLRAAVSKAALLHTAMTL